MQSNRRKRVLDGGGEVSTCCDVERRNVRQGLGRHPIEAISVGESGGRAYLSDAVARVFLLLAARATAFASAAVTTTSL